MAIMLQPKILNEDKVFVDSNDPQEKADNERLGRLPLGYWPRVLAIDPGTHTGWACLWFDDDVLFDQTKKSTRALVAWQAGMFIGEEDGQVDAVCDLLRRPELGEDGVAVVIENFRVRSINMSNEFLSPARIGGAVRWAVRRGVRSSDGKVRRRQAYFQEPSEAIGQGGVSDEMLKLNQIYLPGADHPRDATRHAFVWMRKLRSPGRGEGFFDAAHWVDDR